MFRIRKIIDRLRGRKTSRLTLALASAIERGIRHDDAIEGAIWPHKIPPDRYQYFMEQYGPMFCQKSEWKTYRRTPKIDFYIHPRLEQLPPSESELPPDEN